MHKQNARKIIVDNLVWLLKPFLAIMYRIPEETNSSSSCLYCSMPWFGLVFLFSFIHVCTNLSKCAHLAAKLKDHASTCQTAYPQLLLAHWLLSKAALRWSWGTLAQALGPVGAWWTSKNGVTSECTGTRIQGKGVSHRQTLTESPAFLRVCLFLVYSSLCVCWYFPFSSSDETASLYTHTLVDSLPLPDSFYCHHCVGTSVAGTTYFWLSSNVIEAGTHLCVTYQRVDIALRDEQFLFENGTVTLKALSVYHWNRICSVTTIQSCQIVWKNLHSCEQTVTHLCPS